MSTNVSSSDFTNNVRNFYMNVWQASINVVKTMYNAAGNITLDQR